MAHLGRDLWYSEVSEAQCRPPVPVDSSTAESFLKEDAPTAIRSIQGVAIDQGLDGASSAGLYIYL